MLIMVIPPTILARTTMVILIPPPALESSLEHLVHQFFQWAVPLLQLEFFGFGEDLG